MSQQDADHDQIALLTSRVANLEESMRGIYRLMSRVAMDLTKVSKAYDTWAPVPSTKPAADSVLQKGAALAGK